MQSLSKHAISAVKRCISSQALKPDTTEDYGAAHTQFAASFRLPTPLYFAYCGYGLIIESANLDDQRWGGSVCGAEAFEETRINGRDRMVRQAHHERSS
jgi:hypothetical protein